MPFKVSEFGTNRKLVDDLERRNSLYFAFSPNSIALLANNFTVVEDRPIMCAF